MCADSVSSAADARKTVSPPQPHLKSFPGSCYFKTIKYSLFIDQKTCILYWSWFRSSLEVKPHQTIWIYSWSLRETFCFGISLFQFSAHENRVSWKEDVIKDIWTHDFNSTTSRRSVYRSSMIIFIYGLRGNELWWNININVLSIRRRQIGALVCCERSSGPSISSIHEAVISCRCEQG